MPAEASTTTAMSGLSGRIITCCLGMLFFLPVSLFFHNYYNLPISVELFAAAVLLITFVLLFAFQSDKEGKLDRKKR